MRRETKKIKCGNLFIGGDAPIVIQSMTNTNTEDVRKTLEQIKQLEKSGCEVARIAVPTMKAAEAVKEIVQEANIPIVADIHFDYRLALKSIENGIHKLRINPGNIGEESRVKEVVFKAKEKQVPIRIGVNGGSLSKQIIKKYGHTTPEALVESAMEHIRILEKYDFHDTIISIKASNICTTVKAHELISDQVSYPFHLGITEAGSNFRGTVKSSIGIGSLLLKGFGDTIRASLTADPVEEIKVCKEILRSLGLREFGVNIISCPTCGRTKTDMITIANKIESALEGVDKNITVAIMGCAVNGPGEAREADLGVACGNNEGLIFKKGEILKKVHEEDIISTLLEEIEKYE